MKLAIFTSILTVGLSISGFAQHDHSSHQQQKAGAKADTIKAMVSSSPSQKQLSQLLIAYYNLKNALVSDDATSAAANADVFLKIANSLDYKIVSEGNAHVLSKDAGRISSTRDLEKQRASFVNLSSNIVAIARRLKPGDQPVYVQFCPMKKASWLSFEKDIRNPYYGSKMLTCGEVTETF